MDKIINVHDYLESLPEVGKVLSFGSILRVAEDLNNKKLQSLEIAVLYSKIPDEIKPKVIIHPKSIIGLIPLKTRDKNAQMVVKTV